MTMLKCFFLISLLVFFSVKPLFAEETSPIKPSKFEKNEGNAGAQKIVICFKDEASCPREVRAAGYLDNFRREMFRYNTKAEIINVVVPMGGDRNFKRF